MFCYRKNNTGFGVAQKGQVLLVVVLVMVIALTVGLGVASRSITSLRTATEEENSQRAFSAAEAGIEQALKTTITPGTVRQLSNNSQIVNLSVTEIKNTNEFLVNGGDLIEKDEGTDIWLLEHQDDGRVNYNTGGWLHVDDQPITLYWGRALDLDFCVSGSSTTVQNKTPAIEIVVIYGSKNAPRSTRYGIDPCAPRRGNSSDTVNVNHFSSDDIEYDGENRKTYNIQGKLFAFKKTITISDGMLIRVVPLYSSTSIGVKVPCGSDDDEEDCSLLPSQGKLIESTGESGSTQRKISVFQGYPSLPTEFFPHILFSPK